MTTLPPGCFPSPVTIFFIILYTYILILVIILCESYNRYNRNEQKSVLLFNAM